MTKPIDRLRLGASDDAIALADIKTEDLLASMSDEMKASVAAALTPPAPAAAAKDGKKGKGKDPNEADPNEAEPDDDEDDKKMKKAKAAGVAEGQKAAAERVAAVAASEHFEGREKAAMKLLGSDKLLTASADDIIGLLADMPKGTDASAEMLAALRAKNPNLGTGEDTTAAEASKANNHGWADIHAELRARRGM